MSPYYLYMLGHNDANSLIIQVRAFVLQLDMKVYIDNIWCCDGNDFDHSLIRLYGAIEFYGLVLS